ncbi:MAG: hypothetical protein ACP5RI_00670 [Candidatus Micrarchaeia archaeon]
MEKIEKDKVTIIDPSLFYERRLKYEEKHSAWEGFKSIYWSIYILSLGSYLLYSNTPITATSFFGVALVLFAFFYIVFGLTKVLHLKLMKRFA